MRRSAVDFLGRYGILLAGILMSFLLLPIIAVLGVGRDILLDIHFFLVLATGLPTVIAVAIHLYRDGRTSSERERRLLELNVELRKQEVLLERLAMTDALTGLHNRRYLHERLSLEVARTNRYQRPLALAILDLDHFKLVNDTYGHQFGDFVLAEAGRLLRENLRESDAVARYGGEEFALLLPETSLSQAAAVAEKLRQTFAGHEFRDGHAAVRLTVSVGIAALPAAGVDNDDAFVGRADAALYEAKRLGRNRVVGAPTVEPRAAGS